MVSQTKSNLFSMNKESDLTKEFFFIGLGWGLWGVWGIGIDFRRMDLYYAGVFVDFVSVRYGIYPEFTPRFS